MREQKAMRPLATGFQERQQFLPCLPKSLDLGGLKPWDCSHIPPSQLLSPSRKLKGYTETPIWLNSCYLLTGVLRRALSTPSLSSVSVTQGQLQSENIANQQFVSFKCQALLSRGTKSHVVSSVPPGCGTSVCPGLHLVTLSVIRWAVVGSQCLGSSHPDLLNSGPKPKSRDSGSLDTLLKSHKMLPLCRKVKALDLVRKEKNYMLRLLGSTVKNKSSIPEIVKKLQEISTSFVVVLELAKSMPTVHDKCLVKMENALNV